MPFGNSWNVGIVLIDDEGKALPTTKMFSANININVNIN